MRLKYLSLCLLSLSFLGCTQHAIQESKKESPLLEQRAANGLNAIFETSSFDYNGDFKLKTTLPTNKNHSILSKQDNSNILLDVELNNKIEKALSLQKVNLSSKEKEQLNTAIAEQIQENGEIGFASGRNFELGMNFLFNILNDTQIAYDGSVHYREKQGSLNLKLEYVTPTLEVKAKVPMVFDLKNHKFYVNLFALTPFLANPQQQNSLSYFDFSKYQDQWKDVDIKAFVSFLKESNALPYALAEPKNLQRISVSASEKEKGIVEKIRLTSDLESYVAQSLVFNYVNGPYIYKTILKKQDEDDALMPTPEGLAAEIVAQSLSKGVEENLDDSSGNEFDIYSASWSSSQRLEELVNQHLYGEQVEIIQAESCDLDDVEPCELSAESIEEAYAHAFDSITNVQDVSDTENNLSEEDCLKLKESSQKIPLGLVNICYNNHAIRLIESNTESANSEDNSFGQSEFLTLFSNSMKVLSIFEPYASTEPTDAQAFKEIWNNHRVDIEHILKNKKQATMTIVMDVGLDAKGRAVDIQYNIEKNDKKYGKINLLSSTQISNYGKATPIDRNKLKEAKSIQDTVKNILLDRNNDKEIDTLSFEEILEKIALETYLETGSYIKSYQAVYVLYFAAAKPSFAKYYSASELNEVAELFAYYVFEDEQPNAQTAKRIKQLQEKHQLNDPSSYGYIGDAVSIILDSALENVEVDLYWKNFKRQYKTVQPAFAAHYVKVFKDKYEDFTPEEDALLLEVANIMAKSYQDDVNGKLQPKNISSLQLAHEDLIDWNVYRETYRAIRANYK